MAETGMDLDAARGWQGRMSTIKEGLTDSLNNFLIQANNTKEIFEGAAADGLYDSVNTFIKMAQTYTESMENLNKLLGLIVDTLEKQ